MLADQTPTPESSPEGSGHSADLGGLGALQSRAAALAAIAAQQAANGGPGEQPATDSVYSADAIITSASWRNGWTALIVTMLSRGVATMFASLLLWSLAPALLGWHPTVVMTGSMEPRLHPGDVVVSRPVPTSALSLGQVVLAADPDHPGKLRLHRLAVINADGTLTLRGDANSANDSTPVRRDAVRGVASLHIPYLGLVELWRSEHDVAALALFAAALGALGFGCRMYRPFDEAAVVDHAESPGSEGGQGFPVGLRRLTALTALVLTLAGVTLTGAPRAQAAAKFTRTTSNLSNSWAAVPYFTCKSAVLANSPFLYYQFGDGSGLTAADSSGNARTGTYQGTRTYGVASSCARDNHTAVTLNGSSSYISTPSVVNNPTVFTEEIWFKTTTTTGGDLLGFANTQMGLSTSSDRQLYLTNGGQVVFGVCSERSRRSAAPRPTTTAAGTSPMQCFHPPASSFISTVNWSPATPP